MNTKEIVVGGGCFWCLEAVFNRLNGVSFVKSGYTAGHVKNPSYKEVCSGMTGHNEVIKIEYDPSIITLDILLDLFFAFHDPTTLNRQGNDVGTQYRSGVYYTTEEDKSRIIDAVERAKSNWQNPIVTEIEPLTVFYPAEDYHHDYYTKNPTQGYCNFVINPKVKKLQTQYGTLLKQE